MWQPRCNNGGRLRHRFSVRFLARLKLLLLLLRSQIRSQFWSSRRHLPRTTKPQNRPNKLGWGVSKAASTKVHTHTTESPQSVTLPHTHTCTLLYLNSRARQAKSSQGMQIKKKKAKQKRESSGESLRRDRESRLISSASASRICTQSEWRKNMNCSLRFFFFALGFWGCGWSSLVDGQKKKLRTLLREDFVEPKTIFQRELGGGGVKKIEAEVQTKQKWKYLQK